MKDKALLKMQELIEKGILNDKNTLRREDGRVEWQCEHGVGHTVYSPNNYYVHGCDGCCSKLGEKNER